MDAPLVTDYVFGRIPAVIKPVAGVIPLLEHGGIYGAAGDKIDSFPLLADWARGCDTKDFCFIIVEKATAVVVDVGLGLRLDTVLEHIANDQNEEECGRPVFVVRVRHKGHCLGKYHGITGGQAQD